MNDPADNEDRVVRLYALRNHGHCTAVDTRWAQDAEEVPLGETVERHLSLR